MGDVTYFTNHDLRALKKALLIRTAGWLVMTVIAVAMAITNHRLLHMNRQLPEQIQLAQAHECPDGEPNGSRAPGHTDDMSQDVRDLRAEAGRNALREIFERHDTSPESLLPR